jgi:hypothetical protein
VVVNFRTYLFTRLCLNSIRRYYPDHEIVVVDNSFPPDRSGEYLNQRRDLRVVAYTVHVPGYVTFGQRRDLTLCRLFRNTPQIYYTGRVHESVWASLEALGAQVADSGIVIQHRNDLRPLAEALRKDFYYERLRLGEAGADRSTLNVLLQETPALSLREEDWAALQGVAEEVLVERLRTRLIAEQIASQGGFA